MPTPSGFSGIAPDSKLLDRVLTKAKQISNFGTFFAVAAPITTGILNPILLDYQYKKQHKPDRERKMLVAQEMSKQIINVTTLLSLLGIVMLGSQYMFKKHADPKLLASKTGQDGKAAFTTLITNISGLIALAILSPILTPSFIKLFKKTDKEIKETDKDIKELKQKTSLNIVSQPNRPFPPTAVFPPTMIYPPQLSPSPKNFSIPLSSPNATGFNNPTILLQTQGNVAYGSSITPMQRTAVGG